MKSIQPEMESAARIELSEGVVESVAEASMGVRIGTRLVEATLAPSCVTMPEPGDRALVALPGREAKVIAVTEHARGRTPAVEAAGRPLRLVGSEVRVEADAASVNAGRIALEADEAVIGARRLSLVSSVLTTAATTARTVAESIHHVADRLFESAQRSFRRVEREHLEAGDLTRRCRGTFDAQGEHAVVVARRVAKIDAGDQVQIG